MSDETSARLSLPLLQSGQAQKEVSHNEALVLLDLIVQPVVQAVGIDTPPASPAAGECWIVGTSPTGAWTGQAKAIAGWTSGGWRYLAARDGMTAWSLADGAFAQFEGSAWTIGIVRASQLVIGGDSVVGTRHSAIAGPTGGSVIDTQARAAIDLALAALRSHGLIAT